MAFEGLLRAWSDEHTSYRDASFAILNKPAGVSCDARTELGVPLPTALPARLLEQGYGASHVLSGVPERASGATLVGWGGAPVHAAGPEPIERWTCVVAVDDWRLPTSGAWTLPELSGPLEYRVQRRSGGRALVEIDGGARPDRVVELLRRHGQPVVGDPDSNAPAATRLMLHVSRLRGRVSGAAPLPPEFDSWVAGQAELAPGQFASALARAGVARHGLAPALGALRLLGEEEGEIAGLTVERYGDHAVLYLSSEEAARHEAELCECLMDHGAAGVYVKRRVRADLRGVDPLSLAPPLPVRGLAAPEWLELSQGPLRFFACLGDGLGTGLFLDQRANWGRVPSGKEGAGFLNLFCYTGAFTLAAAAAGASTTSVDLAGRALSRLGKNLDLNGLSGPHHRLLKADVPAWLARARRNPRRYDAIVLDPPSFGTRARGVLSTRRDNPELLAGALELLAPHGRLLTVSHHRKISGRDLTDQIARACGALGLTVRLEPLVGGWDCPTVPGVSATKSVLAHSSP